MQALTTRMESRLKEGRSKARLRARLVMLYNAARLSVPINIINGLIVLYLFWGTASTGFLISWGSALFLISLARMFAGVFVLRNHHFIDVNLWLNAFVGGAFLTGAAWGSLVLAVPMQGETGLYFLCAVFMIAGMTAGATSSASPYFPAGIAFNIPALSIVAIEFLLEGEPVTYAMAFVTVLYGILITQIGRTAEQSTRKLMLQQDIVESQAGELQGQHHLMQQVLNTIGPGVAVYDQDMKLSFCNQSFVNLLNLPKDWLDQERTRADLVQLLISQGEYSSKVEEEAALKRLDSITADGEVRGYQFDRQRPDGSMLEIFGSAMPGGGLVSTYTDITQRYQHMEEVKYIAEHDSLTGLVNRPVFQRRLERALVRARRSGTLVSVYYLDLDHFKDVNDTQGHPIGDEVLKIVAGRISSILRDTDTVARLGGDEFAVIATNHKDVDDSTQLAERILEVASKPYALEDMQLESGVSIGLTIYPLDDSNAVDLAGHADVALYKAKNAGRNRYAIFDEAMNAELINRKAVESDLMKAIENEEFILFYQPKIDFASGKVTGAEALIRWDHPEQGLLTPYYFLEIAERARLINKISQWVVEESVRFLRRMCDTGLTDFKLSINLSADDFKNEALSEWIQAALASAHISPQMLEIEITESMMITDLESASGTVDRMKAAGMTVAIDDFGVGYSSMSYLKDFSADVIKIDRSFITKCEEGTANARVVAGIINLGHSLGMKVVAEGIEEASEADLLKRIGCDIGQGYYFGKPMDENTFMALPDIKQA